MRARVAILACFTTMGACDKSSSPAVGERDAALEVRGCPRDSEPRGAPMPRGAGEWCQRVKDGHAAEIFHPDGVLWAKGDLSEDGSEGFWQYFAPDGRVAMTRSYVKGHANDDAVVMIADVELPPYTLAPCHTVSGRLQRTEFCPKPAVSAAPAPSATASTRVKTGVR